MPRINKIMRLDVPVVCDRQWNRLCPQYSVANTCKNYIIVVNICNNRNIIIIDIHIDFTINIHISKVVETNKNCTDEGI